MDALRAVAMLVGIVLHGAMSFVPGYGAFWGVQDVESSEAFGFLIAPIHGFRMPLFFLVSGFFTAMLWRKRGLSALLAQRFKRIFLPMILGLFTIIPATWIVQAYVRSSGEQDGAAKVAGSGDAAFFPAAMAGDAETMARLIQQGADINKKADSGSTALHIAVFFGRAEVAEQLLGAGADVNMLDAYGNRPADLLDEPWGLTQSVAGMAGVEVQKEEVLAGRERIAQVMEERFGIPVGGETVTKQAGSEQLKAAVNGIILGLLYFPLFGHLWFLWFLCWLVVGFAVCVTLGRQIGARGPPSQVIVSRYRYLWLIPLTAVPAFFMGQEGGFGPATSIGLLPMPAVLAYYAIFFGFGAWYFDAEDRDGMVGRGWWISLPIALLILFPIGHTMGPQHAGLGHLVSVLIQVACAWLLTFGMMGLFRRFCSRASKTWRYISDSSYWLYLAHVPLIMLVQHCVHGWAVSPWIKFPLVCAVTSGILLLSYQLFVRYTWIGTLLNGPRRRAPRIEEPVDALVLEGDSAG